jgi:hypothetical protein
MWSRFDPVAVSFLNKLHDNVDDLSFVWTTSWRLDMPDNDMTLHWAYTMFHNAGFRGKFGKPFRTEKLNEGNYFNSRSYEVLDYLKKYGNDTKDFMVLDDEDYHFDELLSKKRFVKTDPVNGMLYKHMEKAWSLVGSWDKR